MNELLRCDVVLGCTDSYHGRAHLGDLASRYLIPAIDVGVLPNGEGGRITEQMIDITRYSAVDPCPFCHGRINAERMNVELMRPEEIERAKKEAEDATELGEPNDAYWRDQLPLLPSVGYQTTTAGAMLGGYAQNWILGTAEMPHDRFQMDLGAKKLGVTPADIESNPNYDCQKFKDWADQGDLSITRPAHFERAIFVPELSPDGGS